MCCPWFNVLGWRTKSIQDIVFIEVKLSIFTMFMPRLVVSVWCFLCVQAHPFWPAKIVFWVE